MSDPSTEILPPPPKPNRPTGHIPDTPERRAAHRSTKHLLGATVRLKGASSLLAATPPFKSQRMSSSCVGFAVWRICQTRLAMMGIVNLPDHSPRGVYDFARMWARADAKTPLSDDGCMPSDAFEAARKWGVCLERDVPSDANGLDHHINDELDLQAVKDATAFHIDGVFGVDSDGHSRIIDVCHALDEGYPLMMAIAVGDVFQSYDGNGDVGPETDPMVDTNHAVAILAYETRDDGTIVFTGLTPWEDWGKGGGLFTFTKDLLCEARTTDIYAVTLAPKARPKPKKKGEHEPEQKAVAP